jgi:hypothetical protein
VDPLDVRTELVEGAAGSSRCGVELVTALRADSGDGTLDYVFLHRYLRLK